LGGVGWERGGESRCRWWPDSGRAGRVWFYLVAGGGTGPGGLGNGAARSVAVKESPLVDGRAEARLCVRPSL